MQRLQTHDQVVPGVFHALALATAAFSLCLTVLLCAWSTLEPWRPYFCLCPPSPQTVSFCGASTAALADDAKIQQGKLELEEEDGTSALLTGVCRLTESSCLGPIFQLGDRHAGEGLWQLWNAYFICLVMFYVNQQEYRRMEIRICKTRLLLT